MLKSDSGSHLLRMGVFRKLVAAWVASKCELTLGIRKTELYISLDHKIYLMKFFFDIHGH